MAVLSFTWKRHSRSLGDQKYQNLDQYTIKYFILNIDQFHSVLNYFTMYSYIKATLLCGLNRINIAPNHHFLFFSIFLDQ